MYRLLKHLLVFLYRKRFKSCGKNVLYDPLSSFISYKTIKIGDDVYIGPNAFISSSHSIITFGNNIMLGPSVSIYGGNHIVNKVGFLMNKISKPSDLIEPNTYIEDEVWIGGNSVLLPGITIGKGAIVAAGSIVTKDVKPYSMVAGNPAKLIKMRFTEDEILVHERELYGKHK